MNTDEKMVIGIIVFMVLLAGFAIWYEWRYPCLRSETYACTKTQCSQRDDSGICKNYITLTDTCTRCLQRGDREAMPAEVP